MSLPSNVLYTDGRYLIDIAASGCGSGCVYCYVSHNSEPQALFTRELIAASCLKIENDASYSNKTLISLCPNTEPFKSTKSAALTIDVINFFSKRLNPIQISTKEYLTREILESLSDSSTYKNQICINVSIPVITQINKFEPFAAGYSERKENLLNIKKYDSLCSCLYIKPFTEETYLDLEKYIELVFQCKPDYVCVGPYFSVQSPEPCLTLYDHENARSILAGDYFSKLVEFSDKLSKTANIPVFFSSTCVIADLFPQYGCKIGLFKIDGSLCKNCSLNLGR